MAMRRSIRTLRASAAACLLLAAGTVLATEPALPEDPVAALQAAFVQAVKPGEQAGQYQELISTVFQRVVRAYATEVDVAALAAVAREVVERSPAGTGEPAEVFRKAINEALRTLDPYSRYLDAQAHGSESGGSGGSFGGLGLEVEAREGAVGVVAPMPGSPAARAGLQRGDLIVKVDDQPLAGVPLADAIARMRGQPGTPVSLSIRRAGTAGEFTVSLTRDTIRRQLLHWALEGEVLVLRLASFSGPVLVSIEQAIAEASQNRKPAGIVLDLRGNPGGLLREAVTTADAFLGRGEIVSLRGRTPGNQRSWQADPAELLPGLPMVVLVDKRSASAAELVAAALQENGRAKVMGQRSFGKGTVQSTWPLGAGKGALKLTTAVYHGPSGRTVQRAGVAPDFELVGAVPAAPAAPGAPLPELRVDERRCATVLKTPDPALSCAVGYLRAGTSEAFLRTVAAY